MSFDFNPTKRNTARPAASLPAPEPELLSPNDVALPYEQPSMFDDIFRRPPLSDLSPEERAQRTALEHRCEVEYSLAWRVLTHPNNIERYIAKKTLSDEPKARAYYAKTWSADAIQSKLLREAEKLAAWLTATKAEGVDAQQVLYEVFTRTRYNAFTAADRELESLVKRLARVWIGMESPALADSMYLSF